MNLVWLIIAAIVLIGLWQTYAPLMVVLGLIFVALCIPLLIRDRLRAAKHQEQKSQKTNDLERAVREITETHIDTLCRKHHQTFRQDEYGNDLVDDWNRELDYFIENVLLPRCPGLLDVTDRWTVFTLISDLVNKHLETDPPKLNVTDMSPTEFERFCAEILEAAGWETRLTQASGDQGVDIIASNNSWIVAIQCKKYGSRVGNEAVQQIIAGQKFVAADYGVVVSNAPFTQQAKTLAATCGIHLLHYSDLVKLTRLLGISTAAN